MSWYGSHSFLNEYIRENTCKRIMEIGVYNGENARTMVETAIRNVRPSEVEYYGFDFFMDTRFREVRQKLEKTGCKFKLFKGDTFDTLPKVVTTLPKNGCNLQRRRQIVYKGEERLGTLKNPHALWNSNICP